MYSPAVLLLQLFQLLLLLRSGTVKLRLDLQKA